MVAIFQGLVVAGNDGGEKNGTEGNVVGIPPGPEGIAGNGGSLTSGYGVEGKGGRLRPGMEGNSGGVLCNRRRDPTAAPKLENDNVIKKARVMKREVAIANIILGTRRVTY
ncbi:hypothetical protein Dsin_032425 [Dipteronia sinensis]|uniref:Uncharacterized protein n=1 Tax=Dipteronia sinensis TaxID=43782 RepID=A0AAD9ZPP0_9ROSI|nr:hypothetical protein Dsin_032425 [Dipteronia sinensis]